MAPHRPSALLRSAPSVNMFITIDSAAGSTTAALRPWTPRMTIRKVPLVASAQASEAAVNNASPAMNTRLRPSRSAARPPSSRNPPKVSAYAVTTHCRSDCAKCRSRPIVGKRDVDDQHVDRRHEVRHRQQRERPPPVHRRVGRPGPPPMSSLGSTAFTRASGLRWSCRHRLKHQPCLRFADESCRRRCCTHGRRYPDAMRKDRTPRDRGDPRPCPGRRRRGLQRADRSLSPRAAGALLPDSRIGPGR